MGYSPESTERILGCLGHRVDSTQRGTLTKIAAESWNKHAQEMSMGILAIRGKFLKLFDQVPKDSPLRTKFSFGPDRPPAAIAINHKYFKSRSLLGSVVFNTVQEGLWHDYVCRFNDSFTTMINYALRGRVNAQLINGTKKNPTTINKELLADYENAVGAGDNDAAEKIYREGIKWIRDTIRAQAVCNTLQDVETAITVLLKKNRMDEILVAAKNAYADLFRKKTPDHDPSPFMACMLYFEATPNLNFELQLMTARAKIITRLTHPGAERDCPSPLPKDVKELVEILAWASHCLDYQEHLSSI